MNALLLFALLAPRAHAHGGFPSSLAVHFQSATDEVPIVESTFGALVQRSEQDWDWVCEEVVGTAGMTSMAVLDDGTWLFAGIDGVVRSTDHCYWSDVADLSGLYVTQLLRDATVPGRVWATSASGDQDNALWRSDDYGQTFSAFATFGEGSTLRGVMQGRDGAPLALVGWRSTVPFLAYAADGETLTELPLSPPEGAFVYPLGLDEAGRVWLRMPDVYKDRVVVVTPEGVSTEVLPLDTSASAFDAGPGDDRVYVGTKEAGLRVSDDVGASWSTPVASPIPSCLRTHGDGRYVCSHNWSDGASVKRAALADGPPEGWAWTDVLWFGDVHQMLDCPEDSEVAQICAPLWEDVAAASGLNLAREGDDTAAGDDTGGSGGEGGGGADDKDGCGCAAGGGGGGAGLGLLAFALAWRRRRS